MREVLHLQIFHHYQTIGMCHHAALFVVEVTSLVSDFTVGAAGTLWVRFGCLAALRVSLGQVLDLLKFALCFAQPLFALTVIAWVGDLGPVRMRSEVFQSYICAYLWTSVGINFKLILSREGDIVVRTLFDESDSFDLACDVAVLLKAHFPDILEVEFAASHEFAAITITRPSKAMIASASFEAWVAGVLTTFDPSKESLKSFVQTLENILASTKVE